MYSAWASQGASGLDAHFSMVHVAPAWHPIVQPPVGQLRMVHVAPAAHWIAQAPAAQVSITHVAPAEQWSMKHPIWQLPTVQVEPGPHSLMAHPPPTQAIMRMRPQQTLPGGRLVCGRGRFVAAEGGVHQKQRRGCADFVDGARKVLLRKGETSAFPRQ